MTNMPQDVESIEKTSRSMICELLLQGRTDEAIALHERLVAPLRTKDYLFQLIRELLLEKKALEASVDKFRSWVNDLQAGKYINCVYCGHRYGPDDEVEATMQQVLYDHIAECPEHPLSAAKKEIELLQMRLERFQYMQRNLDALTLHFEKPDQVIGIAQVLATMAVEMNSTDSTFVFEGLSWRDILMGDFKITITKTGGPDSQEVAAIIREVKREERELAESKPDIPACSAPHEMGL